MMTRVGTIIIESRTANNASLDVTMLDEEKGTFIRQTLSFAEWRALKAAGDAVFER